MDTDQQYIYQAGGILKANHPTYVERQADSDLYAALKAGEYCYILNSRQMGKSSLVMQAKERLKAEDFASAYVDLSFSLGAENVSFDQWYITILKRLASGFMLPVEPASWWREHREIAPLERLSQFFETFLLARQSKENFIIFIDEIDTVLSLKEFRADDFFAFIRGCYNARASIPEYGRLIFVLIGVATPSDLIADRDRTPFNLGRAIKLTGFCPTEVYPLVGGLQNCPVENPQATLEAILGWTGGQPFLTQKLCQLISEIQLPILAGHEKTEIKILVESQIITNWEEKDDKQHLKHIRDRIIRREVSNNTLNIKDEHHASSLLSLYHKVLQQGSVLADNSTEQEHLRLSGLVVKQDGVIRVYNPIYEAVFSMKWVQQELVKLRPYREQMEQWLEQRDESRLLRGNALQDALAWSKGKQLSSEDQQFLEISQTYEYLSKIESQVADVLRKFIPDLQKITTRLSVVIQEVQVWAGSHAFLTEQICQLLIEEESSPSIPENQEVEYIENLVCTHLVQNWEDKAAKAHLHSIQSAILEDEKRIELLQLYQQILWQEEEIVNDSLDHVKNADAQTKEVDQAILETLLNVGLVEDKEGRQQVSNRLYAEVFNQNWITQELAKQPPILQGRYQVLREETKENYILYFTKEQYRDKQYVVKQLIPASNDSNILEETKQLLSNRLRGFGQVKPALFPDLDPYFDEDKFYVVQEYVDGHNLDTKDEISSDRSWRESKVIDLLIEILESLQPIHEKGLAHLNLKPSNLRRRSVDGKIVLIDFGFLNEIIALTTNPVQPGHFQQIGTPGYTPPEGTSRWTALSYDIYAVGMIGIQALTGIEPKDLPTDPQTGEIIWRFAAPGESMVKVSDELTQILTKMVRHDSAERYTKTSEIYKDLKKIRTKEPFKVFLGRKGLLVAATTVIVLSSAFFGLHQRSLKKQEISDQNAAQLTKLKECNKQIQSQEDSESNLIGVKLDDSAKSIIDNCSQIIDKHQELATAQTFGNKGKALLLRQQFALQNKDTKAAQEYLAESKKVLQAGSNTYKDDPQIQFYLGLAQQLSNAKDYLKYYNEAAKIYLRPSTQIQEEDYFVLTRLASIFSDESNFQKAIDLYNKAVNKTPNSVSPTHRANLRYNQAVLSIKNISVKSKQEREKIATRFLLAASDEEENHKFANDYFDNCLSGNDDRTPTPCSNLLETLPVYSCKDGLLLAITEPDVGKRKKLCEFSES